MGKVYSAEALERRRAQGRAYQSRYRAEHADYYAAYLKEYQGRKADDIAARVRGNEAYAAVRRANYLRNREARLAYAREYRLTNMERARAASRKRRALRASAVGSHSLEDWLAVRAFFGDKCLRCGVANGQSILHADHIVPLSRGGSDNIDNIQPLCGPCNIWKRDRHIVDYRPRPAPCQLATPANMM
jgi:5-methylcytosine-specific restriction endonuclease McrA